MSDDVLFKPKSKEDKQDDFAVSSMRIIARQLGQRADGIESCVDWHWFNQTYPVGGIWIGSARIFKFDIVDLLFRPTKHPVVAAVEEFRKDIPAGYNDFIMIFQVYEWGRMYATSADFKDTTALRVVIRDEPIYVSPLGDLFTKWKPHG